MNIFKTDLIRQLSLLAPVLLLVIANPDTTQADTAKILARNITGAAVAEDANNVEISAAIFSQEDADIILLSETRRAESAIAGILDDGYTLAATSGDGQDIWIRNTGRFSVDPDSMGSWRVPGAAERRTASGRNLPTLSQMSVYFCTTFTCRFLTIFVTGRQISMSTTRPSNRVSATSSRRWRTMPGTG
jgi:hypothetical protein